ncbi:MAG: coxB [Solirubrobacterales bacterium]|nr:coxB [Solirubrobacterales bacterium]
MEQRRGGRNSRRMVIEMFVLGTIASLAGIALGIAIDWFPEDASTQAGPIDTLWDVLVVCSVPIFVGVVIVVVYAARLFKQLPGEEELDGPPIHGNTKVEVVWTALPAILLVALCTYAFVVLQDIEEAPAQAAAPEMVVDVYGEQFAWTFKYAGTDGKEVNTTQLYLPKDRSVKFDVHSKDVIHDFWVPAFRMKVDAVPGVTTNYRVTPTKIGRFPVVCAELCGLGHAYMRQTVTVMEPAAFDSWLQEESVESNAPAGGGDEAAGGATGQEGAGSGSASADGKTIFLEGNDNGATSCAACHALADAGSQEGIGPNLDRVLPGQTAEQVGTSIVDPEAKISEGKPAGVMPGNYGEVLSPAELEAVTAYLVDSTKK